MGLWLEMVRLLYDDLHAHFAQVEAIVDDDRDREDPCFLGNPCEFTSGGHRRDGHIIYEELVSVDVMATDVGGHEGAGLM